MDQLTNRYHNDGGLVVVAANMQQVLDLIAAENDKSKEDSEDGANIALTEEEVSKAVIYPLAEECDSAVYIFPDAGCC